VSSTVVSPATARFGFRILGPFEALADGKAVELGGRKPTELLALLVLHANEVVSADRLVEELWRGEPPRTARKTLQVHISRLRRELGDGVLSTEREGYVLRIERGQLDANVFEDLVERGRDELRGANAPAAARVLRDALALWRGGPALAGMGDEPFARLVAGRLDDLRLVAVELRIDADLALRRHASLVGELEALVAEHPYREGFRRQLILALYRSGRQAEALAAYRSARRTMIEELGVEPGPELRELEASILRHDAALEPPPLLGRPRRPRRRALIAFGIALVALAAVAVVAAFRWQGDTASPPRAVANSVVRIDPATNAITSVTKVGRDPDALAYGAGSLWVVNWRDRTVSRVRPSGEVETIGGVKLADHVVVERNDVWVSSFDRSTVSRFDARTGDLVETIGLRRQHAEGLAVGGGYLWITNPASERAHGLETVSALDLRSRRVVSTMPVGATPIFTTFGEGSVWVANYDGGSVSVISPGSRRAATISACDGPLGIATGYGSVWVVCYWSQQVIRIDPVRRRVVARIPVGAGPLSVTAGAGGVWVTNRDGRTITRIDPQANEVVATVPFEAPLSPQGIAVGDGAVWATIRTCAAEPCI
jgi:DNA-binding SARP family transcriptional activator/DNA-binding beta-propeller fold protein YncE